MSAVYSTLPKLAVRDSLDDDDLTDIDDEVFIRDGRNGGSKLDDDGGVKRPLMPPRRKCKKSCSFQTRKFLYQTLLELCYGITALIVVLGLIVFCIFIMNILSKILRNWLSHEIKNSVNKSEIVPCTSLSSKVLWYRSLPKLTSEAPLRSNDVNLDGIEDIIVGFSTGLDTMDAPEYICTMYFDSQTPCLGGVLALNGKTGDTIWTHWTAHAVFSVDCGVDLTNDKIKDCIVAGRGGVLQAINGRDGTIVWEIPIQDPATTSSEQRRILDVYDARFMADMDGDGIGDVIASHAMQSDDGRASDVLLISGRSGNIIRSANLPDSEQLFIAPQILVHPDGENVFVLATSSQKEAGGLYIASQTSIFYGDLQLRKLYHNTGKGALLPPILIDITSDGVEDIVAAMFNSTIMAYDGLTFEPIWNYTIPSSEVISIPIPGYYNDDDVPDFVVKHQIGAGFPTYYYTIAMVVDGRNGQPLLEKPMEDSLSRQMSGLSITVDGYGNDWFLHWSADCLNHEGVKEKYQFLKGQSLMSQTRADLCRLRFNSTLVTKLLALSQHVGPPGLPLYFSEEWKSLEYNNSIDPREEAEKYLNSHSRFDIMDTYADVPLVSERSPKVHKDHRKESIFKHKSNNLLPEVNKYDNSEAVVYESFDDFKNHKKHDPIENDAMENLEMDRTWKHDGKWTEDNVQSDKEYDGVYAADDDNSEDDEQSVDYPQTEQVREQRSVASGTSPKDSYSISISHKGHVAKEISDSARRNVKLSKDINVEEKRGAPEIEDEAKEIMNETEIIDATETTLEVREEILSTMSSAEETTTISNTLDASVITSEHPVEMKGTNIDFETTKIIDTETFNVPKNQAIIDYRSTSSIKKTIDMTRRRQIYKHSFSNIVQNDADDDASIEKVFKRESLKNQNKGKNNGRRSPIPLSLIANGDHRTKRNSETRRSRSSRINGIQRQSPTGILLPSIAESQGASSVDLVFSTFWLPSSEVSLVLSQTDLECIHRKKALSEDKLQYKKDDDIVSECLSERGVDYRLYQESMDRENTKIALGQMTIYRMKLECVCPEDMLPNQTCRKISLHQSWPEHLGSSGNGYFKSLRRSNI